MDFSAASVFPAFNEELLVQSTFVAAALAFLVSWAIRAGHGRIRRKPEDPGTPAGEATLFAPDGTLPPPLPAASPPPLPRTPTGFFKVGTSPYHLLDLPLIGLVFLVFFALVGSSGGSDDMPLEKKYSPGVLVFAMVFQLTMMGMVIAFMLRRLPPDEWLGLRWRGWPLVFAIAPVTVFVMWILMGALHLSGWNAWLQEALGAEGLQESVRLLMETKDPLILILMAVAAVVVAPVAEEVVFRGYLYPAAKRFCGTAGAVIFSSLVFAAAHGNAMALLPLFILAVVLCGLYEATGSIWAPVSVHFLFNGATVGIQLLARSGVIPTDAAP